jgi:hypothetical protein
MLDTIANASVMRRASVTGVLSERPEVVSAKVKWQSRRVSRGRGRVAEVAWPRTRTRLPAIIAHLINEAQHATYSRATMIRHDYSRIDSKRRANLSHKKKQFAKAEFQEQTYEHRLNFYILPPTAEITLEEFEQWAIDRLKGTPER